MILKFKQFESKLTESKLSKSVQPKPEPENIEVKPKFTARGLEDELRKISQQIDINEIETDGYGWGLFVDNRDEYEETEVHSIMSRAGKKLGINFRVHPRQRSAHGGFIYPLYFNI